ncbi:MAG: hypothetical protein SGILL_003285 [Bacillariaceae sp.]
MSSQQQPLQPEQYPPSTTRPGVRVLHKTKPERRRQQQQGLFGNMFGGTQKLRRHSSKISQALHEAEESERAEASYSQDDSEVGLQEATGIPVVAFGGRRPQQSQQQSQASQLPLNLLPSNPSSGSSWSSTPAEVPYASAGNNNGALSQHHAMPSPEYLAMSMASGNAVGGNNNNINNNSPPSSSSHHLQRIEGFEGFNENSFKQQPPSRNKNNPPRILTPKQTRFQEFWAELKDLIVDLLEYCRAKTWKKKLLTVLLCIIFVLVFYDLIFGHYIIQWLHAFIVWMTSHLTWAVLAFVAIFVVATLLFIPPTLLVFGAGYAFTVALDSLWMGILASVLSCFLGSALGAVIAFLRARYMMRDLVYLFSKRYPLIRVADRCLKTNGFRIMVLLRMCPILPFNGLNYICGITGVSLQDFCTSLIGILPFYIFMVVLGGTAGQLSLQNLKNPNAEHNSRQHVAFWILTISGIVFGLIAMVYTWRLVKAELKKELQLSSEEFETLVHGHNGHGSIETVHRTSSNRVTTILSYEIENGGLDDANNNNTTNYAWNEQHDSKGNVMEAASARSVFSSTAAQDGSNYILQEEGGAGNNNNNNGDNEDNAGVESKWMEDGEEWWMVWA